MAGITAGCCTIDWLINSDVGVNWKVPRLFFAGGIGGTVFASVCKVPNKVWRGFVSCYWDLKQNLCKVWMSDMV